MAEENAMSLERLSPRLRMIANGNAEVNAYRANCQDRPRQPSRKQNAIDPSPNSKPPEAALLPTTSTSHPTSSYRGRWR